MPLSLGLIVDKVYHAPLIVSTNLRILMLVLCTRPNVPFGTGGKHWNRFCSKRKLEPVGGFPSSGPWLSRRVSYMQYSHPVFEDSVNDFIRIANERCNVHAGSLGNLRRCLRISSYVCNGTEDIIFKSCAHLLAKRTTIGRHLLKICGCAFRVLNLHARRNALNAATTSFSLATPLRSASSIVWSSCSVA